MARLTQKDDLPSIGDIEAQLLHFLSLRAHSVAAQNLYTDIAEHFKLTAWQLTLKRATTHESLWHNRVQTARRNLVDKGLLDGSEHGMWSLTGRGRAVANCTLDDL